jgi:exodeoxyribonuclease V gamma subunit
LAYLALLRCCESRFTATELMGLLELDGIREAFGLAAGQVDVLRELVVESGIRWGADGEHLRSELGTDMDDVATWRRGLDRMLLGYATGRDARTREPRLVEAGALSNLRACDGVEGDSARWVGTLGRFFDAVRETAFRFRHPCGPAAWTERLQDVLDTFFRSTDATFAELAEIRSAIRLVGQTAAAAGEAALPYDVIAAAVEAQLHAAVPAATATSNKVLFTPLRTMRPTPRPLLYLLGMTEGVFPRRDDRPTFDLMACARRRGDRSLRLDDRLAFLETLMCARERLVVSYPGCSQKDNESVPPSTVVSELRQYLDDVFRSEGADHKPATPYLVVRHRLQAFHPAYFAAGGDLSSYSKTDFEAAVALRGREAQRHAAGVPSPRDVSQRAMAPVDADPAAPLGLGARPVLALADLQSFFLNPAKAFYVQALQAKLDDPADGVLCDTETLDSEGLGSYQMNEFLLRRALSGGTQEDTVSLLREQGLLPLGTPGDVLAESRQKGLRSFLDATCPETATTIRHVLMAEAEGSETPLLFHGVNVDVAGSVRTVDIEGTRYHVRARYAALKPKDRLKAWIAHLLGHAADGASFTSVVIGQGKDARGAISETLPARPCNAAANLQTLLTLWQAGAARVLPFAPATSYAYADALRKAAGKDADPQEATLQKARDAWHSEHARGDDQDAYLFQVWGIDGPMADPAFAELARAVWDSFLESCSPSNEDDGGEG